MLQKLCAAFMQWRYAQVSTRSVLNPYPDPNDQGHRSFERKDKAEHFRPTAYHILHDCTRKRRPRYSQLGWPSKIPRANSNAQLRQVIHVTAILIEMESLG